MTAAPVPAETEPSAPMPDPASSPERARWAQWGRRALPVFMVAMFAAAIWVIGQALTESRYLEIRAYVASMPASLLWASIGFTVGSYIVLVGYDLLALRYIGKTLPLRVVTLTSFISYAFTNSMGFGPLAGGAVRYRLYAQAGLNGFDITAVIAFCLSTFFAGIMFVGGIALLIQPEAFAQSQNISVRAVMFFGIVLAAPIILYVIWAAMRRRAIVIGRWRFKVPSFGLVLGQIAISAIDIILAAAALYVLLPTEATGSFQNLLAIYATALIAGIISNVPGGLGVFEGFIILMMPHAEAAKVVGGLLAFRAIYYVLPLAMAAALLAGNEIYNRRATVGRAARVVGLQLTRISPQLSAIAAFFAGAVLLVSGATPAMDERLVAIERLLPLPLVEASHLMASIAGIGLLLLSRALLRRLDAAYLLTLCLLFTGAATSLMKGLDYEEAAFLTFLAIALLPARKSFNRQTVLINHGLSGQWMAAIIVMIIGSMWLGFFSYRHVEYSHELWWQFEFSADAPRFLRASLAVTLIAMAVAITQLLKPLPPKPSPPTQEEMRVRDAIVAASLDTRAALALLGDKYLLFSDQNDGFIMYAVRGRSWVVMGDPIGPPAVRAELAWKFRELVDEYDGTPVFYQVEAENLPIYHDAGLSLLKLGDEARVDLPAFSINNHGFRELRYTYNRTGRAGVTFEMVTDPATVAALMPDLRAISDPWLESRGMREKGFSVGFFDEEYLKHFPCALVRKDGKIIAFANLWLSAEKREISVDLMRYDAAQGRHGVMDFLFIEMMQWGKAQGYKYFNLGMAPLSGLDARAHAPVWYRLGSLAYRFGDQFYNFQGLRKYKEKFQPEWRPKYLASPGGLTLGRILFDVTALISRGPLGLLK